MGSRLVAEGIETEDALRFVCAHGALPGEGLGIIRAVQGYLIGKPLLAGAEHNIAMLRDRVTASRLSA